jgi:hypothetical protein
MNLGEILVVNPIASCCEAGESFHCFAGEAALEYNVKRLVSWAVVEFGYRSD